MKNINNPPIQRRNKAVDPNVLASSLADNTKQITDRIISAKDKQFGAIGDGIADDTTALQNFVNYLVTNQLYGIIPKGTYKITSSLNIPTGNCWGMRGMNSGSTVIKQFTDNVPILNMGATGTNYCHHVQITDLSFSYANSQGTVNTSGNCMFFTNMYYESQFERLDFQNGWYGMKIKSGVISFWGCTLNDLTFSGGLTGGAIDMTGTVNAIPNNHFGRIFVDCNSMTSDALNQIKGYNFVIDTIEFLNANDISLISFQAGTVCTIGAVKLEGFTFTKPNTLIKILAGSSIKIGQFNLGGTTAQFNMLASDKFTIFGTNIGGNTGWFELDVCVLASSTMTGTVFIIAGTGGYTKVKHINADLTKFFLQDAGSSSTADIALVDDWLNNRFYGNRGDSDYTITLGDQNLFSFETAFTAIRTVNLPSVNNNLFSGLRYTIRCYGAINGTNTLNIKCAGSAVATVTTDKTVIEFTYKHNNANALGGWKVTGYQTLP